MAQETLTTVFTHGRKRLISLARRLLGSDDSAQDALQEAFCRLWPTADAIRTTDDAERLAQATVHNICIDQLRQEQRHAADEIDPERMEALSFAQSQADESLADQYEAIRRIIHSRLTPLQQRILQRHDAEGCSYADLANEEQMTEMALRQQLSRARKTVRECYHSLSQRPALSTQVEPNKKTTE